MHYLQVNATYEGDWRDGEKNGRGVLQAPEWRYEGDWRADRREGRGVIKGQRVEFSGEWKENVASKGEMVITFPNQSVYHGMIDKGYKEGKGVYIFQDGTTY